MTETIPPQTLLPFTEETARRKVQLAEEAWNTRDPDRVVLAYTQDSRWRNRDEFFVGREAGINDYRIEPSDRRIAPDEVHPQAAES